MLSFPRVQCGIHCRKGFWDQSGSNFGAPGEKFVFHNRSIEYIYMKSHLCSGVFYLNSFGIIMTNDSSNLTTADEAITFLVNQGIYDFCEFQHYTSTSTSLSVILVFGLLLRTTSYLIFKLLLI